MKNTNVRICLCCKTKRPNNEPLETRKFKLCAKCRLYFRQQQKKNRMYMEEGLNSGVRLCTRCRKKRPSNEPLEARKFKVCTKCRLHLREQKQKNRKYIEERCNSGISLCTNCGKERPDDEPEDARKFKNCSFCRFSQRQTNKENQRKIQESLNSGVRLCTRCGKERPDDEAVEARKFKICSKCRLYRRQSYQKKRKYIEQSYNTGHRLCTYCGKERPDDEAEETRKLRFCAECRHYQRNRQRKNRSHVTLTAPTSVQVVRANTRARTRSRTNRASNSSQMRSTSVIQPNQNFTIGTDKRQTRLYSLKSGMISPHQEIGDIQSEPTRLSCNGSTAATDDPNNLGICDTSAIPYVEIFSSDEDDISESFEESSSSNLLNTLKPDPALKCEYRKYFVNDDIVGFLERYIPDTMNKFDVCKIIVALGYPKESIKNYERLTVSDTLEVLIDLMRKDVLHDGSREDRS